MSRKTESTKNMKQTVFIFITLLGWLLSAQAQSNSQMLVKNYIKYHKDIAITEQQRTGVPAAIKLAQGIVETGSGLSPLAIYANNHFGIKCKSNWTGETYTHTDDKKNECFRKYDSYLHSYQDHSDFLRAGKRYASLFELDMTDYQSWAKGLKAAGYATNPSYASMLIKTIEENDLQQYTLLAMQQSSQEIIVATAPEQKEIMAEDVDIAKKKLLNLDETEKAIETTWTAPPPIEQVDLIEYYEITEKNSIKGFYAKKGDLLLRHAIKNNLRYKRLLELNDLNDEPLEEDMFIYLNPKKKTGSKPTHTVKENETLLQISQEYGIQLKELRRLNKIAKETEPKPGAILYLQEERLSSPEVYSVTTKEVLQNTSRLSENDGYIYKNEAKTADEIDSKQALLDAQEEESAATKLAILAEEKREIERQETLEKREKIEEERAMAKKEARLQKEREEAERIAEREEALAIREREKEERITQREQAKLERERKQQERQEALSIERQRKIEERKEKELQVTLKREAERQEKERQEKERLEALRLQQEKIEQEKAKKEQERLEAIRIAEERKEKEKQEQVRLEAIRKQQQEEERQERERLATIRKAQEEEARKEQERIEAEKREQERIANMSPLEKLKSHMDKTVYGKEKEQSKGTRPAKNEPVEAPKVVKPQTNQTSVTLPAGRNEARQQINTPSPKTTNSGTRYHTVKRGETMFSIAKKYDITVEELKKWNNNLSPQRLHVGAKVKVTQ